jgi:uncharacterized LabA/DUF88 family protein
MVNDAIPGSRSGDQKEVAVFVDFENIRYSTINSYGREPDPIAWRDKALKYGLMSVARAYADFDQHPAQARTRLDVAGFEPQHYPAKKTSDSYGREKIASRSDLNLVIDIINTVLARPDLETILLFTGDKDFIRLVTTLRNRLGRKVVICGVPGSVSPDLVAAAGNVDLLEESQSEDVDIAVIKAIDTYVKQLHDGFVPTQSHMSRTLWRFLDRGMMASEHIEAKVMEFLRKGVLTKRQTINGQGQELVTTELNVSHPLVRQALPHLEDEEAWDEDEAVDEMYAEESQPGHHVAETAVTSYDTEDDIFDEPQPPNITNAGSPRVWTAPREQFRYQRRVATSGGQQRRDRYGR